MISFGCNKSQAGSRSRVKPTSLSRDYLRPYPQLSLTIKERRFATCLPGILRASRYTASPGFLTGIARHRSTNLLTVARLNGSLPETPMSCSCVSEEAPHGFSLRSLAADGALGGHRFRREFHHAHGAPLSPQRLPETARRRKGPSRPPRRRSQTWALHLSPCHSSGNEVSGDDRQIQPGTSWDDDHLSQWAARPAEVSWIVVRLLPADLVFRRVSHRAYSRVGNVLSRSFSRGGNRRFPGLRTGNHEQRNLERPALELCPQRSDRRPGLRTANGGNVRLAVAKISSYRDGRIRPSRERSERGPQIALTQFVRCHPLGTRGPQNSNPALPCRA